MYDCSLLNKLKILIGESVRFWAGRRRMRVFVSHDCQISGPQRTAPAPHVLNRDLS